MINLTGIPVVLDRLVGIAADSTGLRGFVLVGREGQELASAFGKEKRPLYRVETEPSGSRLVLLEEGLEAEAAPVAVYDRSVGTLFLVRRAGPASEREKAVLDFAIAATTLLAEKNFELDDLAAAVNRADEERILLKEVADEFSSARNLSDFASRLASKVAKLAFAPRAAVALLEEGGRTLRVVGTGDPKVAGECFPADAGLTGRSIREGRPVIVTEDRLASLPPHARLSFEREIRRGLLVAPILAGDGASRPLGALVAIDGGRRREEGFGTEEQGSLVFLAEYVGSLVSAVQGAELRHEVALARRIVEGLLPRSVPDFPGFHLAGRLTPARDLGGDYFDFLPMGPGRLGLVVADISGHSLPATLLMPVVRASLRGEASTGEGPAAVLRTVARRLHDDLAAAELFLSMVLVVLEDDGSVTYANAGHPPPLLRRRGGAIEELTTGGLIAGVRSGETYEEGEARLDPGDALVLYTDGITESANAEGEMFGIERLRSALSDAEGKSAAATLERLSESAAAFRGGPASDDVTLVVVQGAPRSAAERRTTVRRKAEEIAR